MTGGGARSSEGPRITRALHSRNFRLFFGGQSVSLVGTWITRVATSWLVYRLTGSALLLGVVGFCGQIPTLLLAPIAGVLVDRWDRGLPRHGAHRQPACRGRRRPRGTSRHDPRWRRGVPRRRALVRAAVAGAESARAADLRGARDHRLG